MHGGLRACVTQDLKTLDINTLNPLSPEVISRQATINIGEQQSTQPVLHMHGSMVCSLCELQDACG